ncbi:MAG: hypothetical protein QOD00_2873, partial [Blastocatellia bacterium]|nr:hypothetical protein [Blastocatellia bacterium]
VVVVNFLNRKNEADVRVFQLLSEKFRLFDGVFGASDEVLGAIESGVDFEKRIANIYQNCRSLGQIKLAFDALQQELNEQITVSLDETRRKLLEHFDEEVHERLRVNIEKTRAQIGRFEQWLWKLTTHELEGYARFNPPQYSFTLESLPEGITDNQLKHGRYRLLTKIADGEPFIHYRPGHPLAEGLIRQAKSRLLPAREVVFHYRNYEGKISVIENLLHKSGWLSLTRVAVEALDTEDHLIFSALTDTGNILDQETCERLFNIGAISGSEIQIPSERQEQLSTLTETTVSRILGEIGERNSKFFEQEIEKIDKWAEDRKQGLEIELKELDAEIKSLVRESRMASDLQVKIELRRKASDLEKQRNRKRREIFDAQDEIEGSKEALLTEVQARLQQRVTHDHLFTIRWSVA